MSQSFEMWLVRPTTETVSTTSQATFSFPQLSSSTTDWLKQPVSSAPLITTKATSLSEQEQTPNLVSRTKIQGIQNWLKTVEPYSELDEDDFEIVEESANSMDEYSISMDSNTDIHFSVPEPKVEVSSNHDSADMDIWLKKDIHIGKSQVPDFKVLFEKADFFPYTKENVQTLYQDKQSSPSNVNNEAIQAVEKDVPKFDQTEADMKIWIIGQNKDVKATTITECHMFETLKHESENLLQWIKKEAPERRDNFDPSFNPMKVWTSVEHSTNWLIKTNLEPGASTEITNQNNQSNQDLKLWLKSSGEERGDNFKASSNSGFSFSFLNSDQNQWLRSDAKHSTIPAKDPSDWPVKRWNFDLSPNKSDGSSKIAAVDKPRSSPYSEDDPNQKWLINSQVAPVSIEWKLFGSRSPGENQDRNTKQHFENVNPPEQPTSLNKSSENQWLLHVN